MLDKRTLETFIKPQVKHPERTYAMPVNSKLTVSLRCGNLTERLRAVEEALVDAYKAGQEDSKTTQPIR